MVFFFSLQLPGRWLGCFGGPGLLRASEYDERYMLDSPQHLGMNATTHTQEAEKDAGFCFN